MKKTMKIEDKIVAKVNVIKAKYQLKSQSDVIAFLIKSARLK